MAAKSVDDGATQALAREFHAEGFAALLPRHLRPSDALVERVRAAALSKFDAHLRQASKRELDLRLPKNAEVLDGFYVRQGGRVDMQISTLAFQTQRAARAAAAASGDADNKEEEEETLEVDPAPFREMARCWQSLVDEIFREEEEAISVGSGGGGGEDQAAASVPRDEAAGGAANCRLEYIGCVVARPGDADQNWHLDGVHRNLLEHERADRLNVFVPLVDLSDERIGGTEMKRKSHFRDTGSGGSAAFERYEHLESVTHRVAAGTPIVMDYRVWHRGLSNRSDTIRPLLYFKYVKLEPPMGEQTAKRPAAESDEAATKKKKKRVVLTQVPT